MPKVIFLVLFLTAVSKTGCSPVLPTRDVLTSSSARCLPDYCCMLFESTAGQTLQGEGLLSVGHAEDPGHLPERPLLTMSEGRVICKGSVHDTMRKPKNSKMLCRRLYDQRNYGQSKCRFSTNRRPQEDAAKTQEAALDRARTYPNYPNPRMIGKLLNQRPTSTAEHPWQVESRRKTRQPDYSLTAAVSGKPEKVSDVLAAYKLWRDANGYGKQNARWGRSLRNLSWSPDRRETTKRRRNGATKEDLIISRSNSIQPTGKTMPWIVNYQPELDALVVSYLATYTSGLVDAAGGKPNGNGNVTRRKRTYLNGQPRLSSGEEFSPEMKEVLEGYLDWRSKNGYGKLAGRWG